MVNTSSTCATTRLTQCRDFGVYMNDVTKKFLRDPEQAPDLSEADFMARKNVIEQVSEWSEGIGAEWPPILYLYEVRIEGILLQVTDFSDRESIRKARGKSDAGSSTCARSGN